MKDQPARPEDQPALLKATPAGLEELPALARRIARDEVLGAVLED